MRTLRRDPPVHSVARAYERGRCDATIALLSLLLAPPPAGPEDVNEEVREWALDRIAMTQEWDPRR